MTSEVLDKIVQLLTAAFGLVAALAWNEAVQGLFRALFPEAGDLLAKFVYAVVVTAVVALVSLGNTPTILVLLFTSLKSRSSMLVVRIRAWCFPG